MVDPVTVVGSGTLVAIGIAIGTSRSMTAELKRLARKLHDIEDWRNATLPKEYVQKEALALQLKPIETQLADIAKDVKSVTRWIDQHGGAGV